MVDIPVPWILWEDVWKDVCVCGTVLVGEVDVDFFVFEMDI